MLPISKIALFIEVILYHTEFQIYLNPHCLSYFYSNFEKGHIALDIKKGFVNYLNFRQLFCMETVQDIFTLYSKRYYVVKFFSDIRTLQV